MDEFAEYARMRAEGVSAVRVHQIAVASGVSEPDAMRLVCAVFVMTPDEAEAIVVVASGTAASLFAGETEIAAVATGAATGAPTGTDDDA